MVRVGFSKPHPERARITVRQLYPFTDPLLLQHCKISYRTTIARTTSAIVRLYIVRYEYYGTVLVLVLVQTTDATDEYSYSTSTRIKTATSRALGHEHDGVMDLRPSSI